MPNMQPANSPGQLPHRAQLAQPTNAHIPLAMQTRPRDTSDPHAALLVAAAARAPGSPPQHAQTHAQAGQYQTTPALHPESDPLGRRPSAASEGGVRPEWEGLTRESSVRKPELALDVKRLLAKPASVSMGRARTESSDSDGTGTQVRRKRYDAAGRRVDLVQEELRGTQSADGGERRLEERRLEERATEKSKQEIALALVGPHSGGEEKTEKRTKNVLKRRPSAARPPAAPQAAVPPPATLTPPVERARPPVLSLNLSLSPMPLPYTDLPSPRGSPVRGSPVRGSPARGSPASAASGSGNGPLTPAGAVVQAYKRGLDTNSPGASPLPSPSSGFFKRKQKSESGNGHGEASPPATPYYTVFGSTSGRVVAVGGPEDAWDGAGSYISSSAFPIFDSARSRSSKSPGPSDTKRTLTRKVSERWPRKREDAQDDARAKPSTQERRGRKSGRSGDELPSPAGEPDSSWGKASGLGHSQPEGGDFKNEPRSRRSEPALGGGSKIWKLMKRISTGGLKEKYDRGPRSLPPIPPLPAMPDLPPVPQLSKENFEAKSADGHTNEEPGAVSRFLQSRPSVSTSRPTLPGSGLPRPVQRSLPVPPPIPVAHHSRPSMNTRSSSPVSSSDVASSKYFHKTPGSTRSSTSSSYGDETHAPEPPPPMPGVPIVFGKHIVPPKELIKLDLDSLPSSLEDKKLVVKPAAFLAPQSLRAADDWTIINTPAQEYPPSLPHPPRRLPAPAASATNRRASVNRLSDSPSIPEFSTAAPINTFTPRKSLADKPRVESMLASLGPPLSRRSMSASHDEPLTRQISLASTEAPGARLKRLQHRSTSLPRVAAVAPEPLTFRDLSGTATHALTEKEKAARWDDLLERSERAGGTIRLGTSEQLLSDQLSLRNSTTSTQLLKDF